MENKENTTPSEKCTCKSDLKTFLIAFLTSVIVVALYHFGMGALAIYKGTAPCEEIPVAEKYVLVPVASMPEGMCDPCPRKGMRHGMHHGRKGMFRKGMHHGMKPMCPMGPMGPQRMCPGMRSMGPEGMCPGMRPMGAEGMCPGMKPMDYKGMKPMDHKGMKPMGPKGMKPGIAQEEHKVPAVPAEKKVPAPAPAKK